MSNIPVKFGMGQETAANIPEKGTILFVTDPKEQNAGIILGGADGISYNICDKQLRTDIYGSKAEASEDINIAPMCSYTIQHSTHPHGFMGNNTPNNKYVIYNAPLNTGHYTDILSYDNNWFGFVGWSKNNQTSDYNTKYDSDEQKYYGEIQFTFKELKEATIINQIQLHCAQGHGAGIEFPTKVAIYCNEIEVYNDTPNIIFDDNIGTCQISTLFPISSQDILTIKLYIHPEYKFIFINNVALLASPTPLLQRHLDGIQAQNLIIQDQVEKLPSLITNLGDDLYTRIKQLSVTMQSEIIADYIGGSIQKELLLIKPKFTNINVFIVFYRTELWSGPLLPLTLFYTNGSAQNCTSSPGPTVSISDNDTKFKLTQTGELYIEKVIALGITQNVNSEGD